MFYHLKVKLSIKDAVFLEPFFKIFFSVSESSHLQVLATL